MGWGRGKDGGGANSLSGAAARRCGVKGVGKVMCFRAMGHYGLEVIVVCGSRG